MLVQVTEENGACIVGVTDVGFDFDSVFLNRLGLSFTRNVTHDFILVDAEGFEAIWEPRLNLRLAFATVSV